VVMASLNSSAVHWCTTFSGSGLTITRQLIQSSLKRDSHRHNWFRVLVARHTGTTRHTDRIILFRSHSLTPRHIDITTHCTALIEQRQRTAHVSATTAHTRRID
jgi:hypothetical protein